MFGQQQDPRQRPISVTLPLASWQVVLEFLDAAPHGRVAVIVGSIIQQANSAQMQPQPPVEIDEAQFGQLDAG